MTDLVGQTIGQYRVTERIRRGYMCDVYKAFQPGLDREVAIKVLPATDSDSSLFLARFKREAKSVAQLQHPNILSVYDYGQQEGYTYFVMPYIRGAINLHEQMKAGLRTEQILHYVDQIGAALDHAHAKGIVHRDVKPSNVLIDGDWALLTDFGLAKISEALAKITCTGVCVGTLAYMAPEQSRGLAVDHRADIYSMGIILYEMVTGQVPHAADTAFATLFKRSMEPPPPPRVIAPDVSEGVDQVILKALAPNLEDRFQSAGELARAFREANLSRTAHDREISHMLKGKVSPNAPLTQSKQLLPPWARRVALVVLGLLVLALPIKESWDHLFVNQKVSEIEQVTAAPLHDPDTVAWPTTSTPATIVPTSGSPAGAPLTNLPEVTLLYKFADDRGESLYAKTLPTGQVHLLASGVERVSAVMASSGDWVVVDSQNANRHNLYLMDTTGNQRRALVINASEAYARFSSDDGTRLQIAWRKNDRWTTQLMHADGSNQVDLVSEVNDYSISWDSRWQKAVISVQEERGYRLYLTDGNGQNRQALTYGKNAAYSYLPEISRDGQQVIYRTYDGENLFSLFLAQSTASEAIRLLSGVVYPTAKFSPSGERLLLQMMAGIDMPYQLNLVDLITGQTTFLIEGDQINAGFSPNERWVTACVRRQGVYHLYMISVDGTKQRHIAGPSSAADWLGYSLDGQWVLASADQNRQHYLFLVSIDGTTRRELVGADANADAGVTAMFSPDGESVLVRLDYASPPRSSLRLLSLDGTRQALLSNEVQIGASAQYTPDADYIVFDTRQGEAGRICVADANGENVRELTAGFAPLVARNGGEPDSARLTSSAAEATAHTAWSTWD